MGYDKVIGTQLSAMIWVNGEGREGDKIESGEMEPKAEVKAVS